MNKSTLAGAAMIAAAVVTVPAVMAWSQSPPTPPGEGAGAAGRLGGPAGPGGPDRDGMRREGGRWAHLSPQQVCVDRIARRAGFIATIGFRLNLTAEQKPLWDKVVTAAQTAQDNERKLCAALPASMDERGKQTVLDLLHHRQQMLEAQLQGLQQTEPAVQALYDKLTPEQKAIVDHPFRRG